MPTEHQIIQQCLVKSTLTGPETQTSICLWLSRTLHLPGDIVECGCHRGNTTLVMMRFLKAVDCLKQVHVYDSFEGVPDIDAKDGKTTLHKGSCAATVEEFRDNTKDFAPVVHPGWFSSTLPNQLPQCICFGFLDGDLYKSIEVSLVHVCPRLVQYGVVVVHDYARDWLPGVKTACDEYLASHKNFASNRDNTGQLVIMRMH